MSAARLAVAPLAAIIGLAGLAACSGTAPAEPSPVSALPAPRPTPAPNSLASAISGTAAMGVSRVRVELVTVIDGSAQRLTGTGAATFRPSGVAELAWQSSTGRSAERLTRKGLFVQADPPDGAWLLTSERTPTIDAAFPLRGLDELRDIQGPTAGAEGVTFTGTLPAKGNLGGLGLDESARSVVEAEPAAQIEVTVTVGPDGRITGVDRVLQRSSVSATSVSRFTPMRENLEIDEPSSYATMPT